MKKVLIVDLGASCGGVEKLIDSIYDRLDKNIYHIDLLIYGNRCFNEEKYQQNGDVYKIAKRYDNPIRHYRDIKNFFMKHNDYDIVWIQTRSSSNVNAHIYARQYTKAKIITHSHSIKPETRNLFHKFITSIIMKHNKKILASCTDYAIACSNDAYQYMFEPAYHGDGKVIINGINLNDFRFDKNARETIREQYSIPEDSIIMGHVGRMVPVKNQRFVIDIFKELQKLIPSLFLFLVGDGPEKDALKKSVIDENLTSQIIFTGEANAVSSYLSAFDVFLLPSFFEGLSISAIEAQATGLPTFLSDHVPEDVMATENAYRFDLKLGADGWSKKIYCIIKNKNIDRCKVYENLIGSPYDIENTVKEIRSILGV